MFSLYKLLMYYYDLLILWREVSKNWALADLKVKKGS